MSKQSRERAAQSRWQVYDIDKAGLAVVAWTGSYTDLLNKPFIPAAQVNADWNATSGVSMILNKPVIPAAQVNSDWAATSGVAAIMNKPTIPAAQVQTDWTATTGMASILNKPTIPKVVYYNVTTDANGLWTANISGFVNVSHVSCVAVNTANTAAGARIATLSNFTNTLATGTVCLANSITSILGLLGLGLSGAGVTVRVRVEGT